MSTIIGVVHATRVAVSPIEAAFECHWPEAEVIQLLDESLSRDLDRIGHLTPAINERVESLAAFAHRGGAQAILYSCSAFGPAIEAVQEKLPIPILKPNQAMLDEALALGGRIRVLATFRPSGPSIRRELEALAAQRKVDLDIEDSYAAGALDALHAGDGSTHDALIAEAAVDGQQADAVLLAQFSMARARDEVSRRVDARVLSSPDSARTALSGLL
ncbi:MAG: aspartate/glutamate racemase family protein, partial [Nitrospinae bacterium]|nr:aspartate/glutamate racemase family protein [Nitrospinota bacterium]